MMRPLCVYDPNDLNSLNNCCPIGYNYNSTHWEETKALADLQDPKYSGPELICIESSSRSLPFVAEDPEKMDDSSSYNVGLNIFAILSAGLLFLQQ